MNVVDELPKIVSARITALPKNFQDPLPKVFATLDDGTEVGLFAYYPDEISFKPEEFIGLTVHEAHALKVCKDQEYLNS